MNWGAHQSAKVLDQINVFAVVLLCLVCDIMFEFVLLVWRCVVLCVLVLCLRGFCLCYCFVVCCDAMYVWCVLCCGVVSCGLLLLCLWA